MKVRLQVDGETFDVELTEEDGRWTADVDGTRLPVRLEADLPGRLVRAGDGTYLIDDVGRDALTVGGRPTQYRILELHGVAGADDGAPGGLGAIHAPMTGKVEDVRVKQGDQVAAGDVLFVLEAMKMRNQVKAQADALVEAVHVRAGTTVDTKTVVLDLAAID